MEAYKFRLAKKPDKQNIINFVNRHWGHRHVLINLPDFFSFYYETENDDLNFALATENNEIVAVAGFVLANCAKNPDVWVSLWVASKTATGSGLELMNALQGLIGCRTLCCNNIRPETRKFYEFLGFHTGKLSHFYKLANLPNYKVAVIKTKTILPVFGNAVLRLLKTELSFLSSGFIVPKAQNPYKSREYIANRYYNFPRQKYDVWAIFEKEKSTPSALLVTRTIEVSGTFVLRIVDYIGDAEILPLAGEAINKLMLEKQAEFTDVYCAGISSEIWKKAGFCLRGDYDENIIPNYLTPPLLENIDYYYFTNNTENFKMFKADGDQDRPNIAD